MRQGKFKQKTKALKRKIKALKRKIKALRVYALRYSLYKTTFIAITGSCGKTSATHFLGHILSSQSSCLVGIDCNTIKYVIQNLLKAKHSHRYVLQEIAAEEQGSLAPVLSLFKPQVGIVTTIGQDHYSKFRTLEATAKEKSRMVEVLPKSGVAVLNADDPHVLAMAQKTRASVITYGESPGADVFASDVRFSWPAGLSFTVSYRNESARVEVKLFGKIWVSTLLAAIAGALANGIALDSCISSLRSVKAFNRRMSVHRLPNDSWCINDTFKAPYWSVAQAMDVLKDLNAARKTIVLGSFSDNPGASSPKYRQLAKKGLEIADRVIFVGEKAKYVKRLITPELEGRLLIAESAEKACELLSLSAVKNEIVFIKSNNADHLERLIHGQSNQMACWKHTCEKISDCAVCIESGMKTGDAGSFSEQV